jgi:hypothetical protein
MCFCLTASLCRLKATEAENEHAVDTQLVQFIVLRTDALQSSAALPGTVIDITQSVPSGNTVVQALEELSWNRRRRR